MRAYRAAEMAVQDDGASSVLPALVEEHPALSSAVPSLSAAQAWLLAPAAEDEGDYIELCELGDPPSVVPSPCPTPPGPDAPVSAADAPHWGNTAIIMIVCEHMGGGVLPGLPAE